MIPGALQLLQGRCLSRKQFLIFAKERFFVNPFILIPRIFSYNR